MLAEYDPYIYAYPELSEVEERAWKLYCQESAGMISAKDFWQQLPENTKNFYLEKVKYDKG